MIILVILLAIFLTYTLIKLTDCVWENHILRDKIEILKLEAIATNKDVAERCARIEKLVDQIFGAPIRPMTISELANLQNILKNTNET